MHYYFKRPTDGTVQSYLGSWLVKEKRFLKFGNPVALMRKGVTRGKSVVFPGKMFIFSQQKSATTHNTAAGS